jgi:hypothetical protein
MTSIAYTHHKVGTVNANVKFRMCQSQMKQIRDFFAAKRKTSLLFTTLVQRAVVNLGERTLSILKKVTSTKTFEYEGNVLEFANGSFVSCQGNGWYSVFGNDDIINSCFVAMNAVISAHYQLFSATKRSKRPSRFTMVAEPDGKGRFNYVAYTLAGVPIDKVIEFKSLATINDLNALSSKFKVRSYA